MDADPVSEGQRWGPAPHPIDFRRIHKISAHARGGLLILSRVTYRAQDGQSNGMELGDPCCEWKEGAPSFVQINSFPVVEHASVCAIC